MRRRLVTLASLLLLGSGCGEARLLDGFAEGQTRIRLAPDEFVGAVPCQKGTPGALQSYVAVLQEVSASTAPDAGGTTVFTTGAVPCDQAVWFPAIAFRFYAAEVYGFEDLAAQGAPDLAQARWRASCGRGRILGSEAEDAGLDPYRPTYAQRGATVQLRGCTPFEAPPGRATQLVIDQASALDGLGCGAGPGAVYAFRGTLNGVTRSARCGEPLAFELPAREQYYTVELTGLAGDGDGGAGDAAVEPPPAGGDAGADAGATDPLDASVGEPVVSPTDAGGSPIQGVPRWRTRCIGRTLPGASTPAVCEPLALLP